MALPGITRANQIPIMDIIVTVAPATQSSNGTNGSYDHQKEIQVLTLHGKVIYGIIISCMVITCVGGNILTIISYCQDRKLRTVHNMYLMSLAVADLFVGCISMPFYAVYTLSDYARPFGVILCKIVLSIDFMATFESVLVLILVSYDRCMLVRQGTDYSRKQTTKCAINRITVSWILAFIVYVPAIVSWDYVRGYSTVDEVYCDFGFWENLAFMLIVFVTNFFIPLISITSLNVYLYVWIRNRSRNQVSFKVLQPSIKVIETSTQQPIIPKLISTKEANVVNRRQNTTMRGHRKATSSLAILVGVFASCWMPYAVCTLLKTVCAACVDDKLYQAFIWLILANSTLNPFLYAFVSERFRCNFIRLLHLRKFCRLKVEPVGGQKENV